VFLLSSQECFRPSSCAAKLNVLIPTAKAVFCSARRLTNKPLCREHAFPSRVYFSEDLPDLRPPKIVLWHPIPPALSRQRPCLSGGGFYQSTKAQARQCC